MTKFKRSDVITVCNHPEFTDRLAVVDGPAQNPGRFMVYLLGKPIDYDNHCLTTAQMRMFEVATTHGKQ